MNIHSDETSSWFDSLEDVLPEYTAIKVWSLIQFFKLEGRKTTLCKDNLIPIKDIQYVIFSPHENRYYLRTYRNYSLNMLYFYTRDIDFSGEDVAIENLRRYVYDGNVYLLFDETKMLETKKFLKRLWESQFNSDGQVRYKDYIDLLTQSIDLEDYRDYSLQPTGHRTVENQFRLRIKAIWDRIAKNPWK